jgi:hypothetical protein
MSISKFKILKRLGGKGAYGTRSYPVTRMGFLEWDAGGHLEKRNDPE